MQRAIVAQYGAAVRAALREQLGQCPETDLLDFSHCVHTDADRRDAVDGEFERERGVSLAILTEAARQPNRPKRLRLGVLDAAGVADGEREALAQLLEPE